MFKVGKLKDNNSKITITEENNYLYFFIETDSYSVEFHTTVGKDKLLELDLGREYDLCQFIDCFDIVICDNGVFSVDNEMVFKIQQYLTGEFVINLFVRSKDTIIYIEEEFKIEELK